MIKAVIFDLDGVLVRTDEMHFLAWMRLAQELGIKNFTKEDNLLQRGVSRMESLEVVLNKSSQRYSNEEKSVLAKRKNSYYVELLQALKPSDVLRGARHAVEGLRAKGVLTAIGSASKNTPLILEKTGLAPLFDAVADGNDIARSKPDPQVFLVAAQKLGIPPEHCLVVEDADAGIQAGRCAGMKTLGVGPAACNPKASFHAQSLADPTLDWRELLA